MRLLTDLAHLDAGSLSAPVKTPEGFLRADAYATRAGVFPYRQKDGSTRLEYRPPEEVFKADSLATMRSLPVTDDHPPGLLTSDNAREYTRGSLGDTPRRDGERVAISLLVTDAELIAKMDAGMRATSCGYKCDLEIASGTTPKGERYDAIQRNIRYNHLAVLERGRAGPDITVRMDAAEMTVVLDPHPAAPSGAHVRTIRIDGIDFPADSDAAVQALARMEERVRKDAADKDALVKAANERADKAEKAHTAAVTELDKVKKDSAELPAKLKAEIAARNALETKARKVLGEKVKLDGLETRDVQVKVLAKLAPKSKMDGKSDAVVEARFDSELERFDEAAETRTDGDEPEPSVDDPEREDGEDEPEGEKLDSAKARDKTVKASSEMWKRPIGATLSEGARGLKVHRS